MTLWCSVSFIVQIVRRLFKPPIFRTHNAKQSLPFYVASSITIPAMTQIQKSSVQIRDAHTCDIEGILSIYNDAVVNTTAIWNEKRVDHANRATWLADRQRAGYPVIVATDKMQTVAGYASFGDWRAFDGYRYTVEHSVYVRSDCRGAGVGKLLMVSLIARARAIGKHVMIAGIESKNFDSIQMHKKLGFVEVGLLPEVGYKFGQWLDLAFLQLKIDSVEDS